MKKIFLAIVFASAGIAAFAQGASGYKISKTFSIKSSGGWDYILADPNSNRLYVSHGAQVNILDKTTGDSIGIIPNTPGVHGIALVQVMGKGYTSNGRANSVTVFNMKTAEIIGQVNVGQNPDAIMYDEYSNKIITCNGASHDLSIIDPATDKVVTTIPVGGKPETAVSDNEGKIYVNIEDKNEIAVVDIKTKEVKAHWPVTGESPTGLAIDRKAHRLFAGCDKKLVVLNTKDGAVVATVNIGEGCDGVGYDAERKLVFASCGIGVLSVIKQDGANTFTLLDNVPSKRSARTIAVDEITHTVYLPFAEVQGRTPVPGTFGVAVISK